MPFGAPQRDIENQLRAVFAGQSAHTKYRRSVPALSVCGCLPDVTQNRPRIIALGHLAIRVLMFSERAGASWEVSGMSVPLQFVARVALMILVLPSVCLGESVDVQTVVVGLRDAFARALNVELRGVESSFVKGWNLSDEVQLDRCAFEITSSGDYWRIHSRSDGKAFVDGRFAPNNTGYDYILGPEGAIFCDWWDNTEITGIVVYERGKSDAEELDKTHALGFLGTSSLVLGYLNGNANCFLPDVLAESTVKQMPESEMIILETDGDWGTWEVYIDTTTFLPKEISIELDERDFFGQKRISEYKPSGDRHQLYPNRQLRSVHIKIRFSSTALKKGESVITGIDTREQLNYQGGVVFERRSVVEIDNVVCEPQPDEKFHFAHVEIPDGTPVQLAHARQLPYIWKGGEVVKGLPRRIEDAPLPFRQRRSLRGVLVLGSVTLILILGGLLWLTRRARTSRGS